MPLPAEIEPASIPPSPPSSDPSDGFAVVGYFPDYRELNPEWGRYLTDILYFSAGTTADGRLDTGRLNEDALNALHEMQGRYGVRVHLSIGGWERSEHFAAMTGDAQARGRFLDELATYVYENKINGVDFGLVKLFDQFRR